jgi:hypothetical protein
MICFHCKIDKDASLFYKGNSKSSGLFSYCKECSSKKAAVWREQNKERHAENRRRYYAENSDKEKVQMALWREQNPAYFKEWKYLNLDKARASYAKRRACKKSATPNWLTKEQKEQILYFYQVARDAFILTGEFYEVDHIEPLINKEVCGLHVPWNLQVLPRDINREKSNKRNTTQR